MQKEQRKKELQDIFFPEPPSSTWLGTSFMRDLLTPAMWTFLGDSLPMTLIRRLNEAAFIADANRGCCSVATDADEPTGLSDDEKAKREKLTAEAGLQNILFLK
jgi:hypothetical protein